MLADYSYYEKRPLPKGIIQVFEEYRYDFAPFLQNSFRIQGETYHYSRAGYFISTVNFANESQFNVVEKSQVHLISCDEIQLIKNEYLNDNHLWIGHWQKTIENSQSSHIQQLEINFYKKILRWHIDNLYCYLKVIYLHLKTRKIDKGYLIDQINIQQNLSEVVVLLEKAQAYLNDFYAFHLSMQAILKASQILAKLSGGLAFIGGNMIDLCVVITLIENIYFHEGMDYE